MTVSSTPSTQPSINTLILLAYKRAGLEPVEATTGSAGMTAKLAHGRQLLDLILDNLAVQGFVARTTVFYDLPIVAGTSRYTLPDAYLDVFEDAMFIPDYNTSTLQTTGELVCKQVDLGTWQSLTTKGSSSTRPTLYAAARSGALVQVDFWPVPSDAGTMRMKVIRLLGDNSTGTNTVDLQRYWFDALVWLLAYYVAVDSSMPLERVNFLLQVAEGKKRECVSYSFEHTGSTAVLNFPTQWSQ